MNTHHPPAETTDTPPRSPQSRWWSALAPAPVPNDLMVQPQKGISGWTAYPAWVGIYLLVFSVSLIGVAVSLFSSGEAPKFPAPNAETFWLYAGFEWTVHAVLLGLAFLCLWLACRWVDMPIKKVFTRDTQPLTASSRWKVFAWTYMAFWIWMAGTNLIGMLAPPGAVGGPIIETPADAIWTSLSIGPTQITTAFLEETVVVGLLVVLLTAAQRPGWEIYTLTALAKIAYHGTYGLAALAMVPTALIIVWLYRRTGRLWPIIAAHAAYNVSYSALLITMLTISS